MTSTPHSHSSTDAADVSVTHQLDSSGSSGGLSSSGPAHEPTARAKQPFWQNWIGYLGVVPFFAFVTIFLILPIIQNTIVSFQPGGEFGFDSLAKLFTSDQIRESFMLSTQLSLVTAFIGGIIGLALGWALVTAPGPKWLKGLVNSYSALASQSGGVPLAYAFVATLGAQGVLTKMINDISGGAMADFKLASFTGVAIVYLYFQFPLMAIVMVPALQGLKKSWFEAATSLGATRWQYIKDVVVPILTPSLLSSFLLLFANSFAAYATAYALAGGGLNLVPIQIGFYISGDVLSDESLAAALVTGMIIVVVIAMSLRAVIERRSRGWLDS